MDKRDLFRKILPEVPVFVISVDKNGKPNGMVAGWNMKCSHDPFRYAVCLSKKGNTHKLILESKEFVVAVASKEIEKELLDFGTLKGESIDKFIHTNIETIISEEITPPSIKHAAINLECTLYKSIDVGDHYMFIGDIQNYSYNTKKVLFYAGKNNIGERIFLEN